MSYLLIEYQKCSPKLTAVIVTGENGNTLMFPSLADAKIYATNFLGLHWTTAKLED